MSFSHLFLLRHSPNADCIFFYNLISIIRLFDLFGNRKISSTSIPFLICIRGFCLHFFDSQIGQHIFEYFFHHRCRNGSSIIHSLWMIDHDKSNDLWILCRCKSKKRCDIFMFASWKRLRSRRLATDGIPFNRRIFFRFLPTRLFPTGCGVFRMFQYSPSPL